uniref:C-mannosyltransferase dpy-19 n=1 Tax=Panagrolaimus sp. ES5 TaxID=591445 RepID=A0AC34FFH4_9BILA
MARQKAPPPAPEIPKSTTSSSYSFLNSVCIVLAVIILWIYHFRHLSTLFENDRQFSHLADFEREMTYRTEMGLYYSYYKTIINAKTFSQGVIEIMYDNKTEYGHTINTLERFNLYPEVVLAALYRTFTAVTKSLGMITQSCYIINRGDDLSPVESCEGIGNPHYFYISGAFFIAGSVLPSMYLLGYLLSDSHIGAFMSAAAFMFNHSEATRVQWTPPLRETFGYPLFLAHIVTVTYILKHGTNTAVYFLSMIFNVCFLLSWQFAQFALFTQLAALYAAYMLEYISLSSLRPLFRSYLAPFVIAYGLLFGNRMLLSSLYFTSIVAINIALILRPILNRIQTRPLYILVHIFVYVFATFGTKALVKYIFTINDDDHVFDILRSKFTEFANFHTKLYTCAAEFDFLGPEYIKKLTQTALLPFSVLAAGLILFMLLRWEIFTVMFWYRSPEHSNHGKPFAELVYHFGQFGFFALMAGLIMRLKLFLTPELCAMVSILFNKRLFLMLFNFRPTMWRIPLAVAIFACMAYKGMKNIEEQRSITGSYSNIEQENLFNWITENTRNDAVFAGSMPVMANLKLSTDRPIANHPHYEHEEIRNRTLKIYSLYSRKPLKEVHQTLKNMGINYYVFQPSSCTGKHPKPNCTYIEMWDMEDPKNIGNPSLCDIFGTALGRREYSKIRPFKVVYTSSAYIILELA